MRWVTVSEAARHFGVTRQRVHKMICKGATPAMRASELSEAQRKQIVTRRRRRDMWVVQLPGRPR